MTTTFKIEYHTRWGENLALVAGDIKYPMTWTEGDIWTVTLNDCNAAILKDYTYIVMVGGIIMRTEWKHHSRSGRVRTAEDSWIECPIPGCPFPREHSAAIFDQPGFRGAGTSIPLFSLRSEQGFGVGEFTDIPAFADWIERTGQKIIQLLPVNDTSRKGEWGDSYPYKPISAFALHPIYIHLQDVGVKEDAAFRKLQAELNGEYFVNYPKVFKAKMKYLRAAFADHGAKDMAGAAYKRFAADNAVWLEDYATVLGKRHREDPDFYRWVQFHADKQFSKAVEYAHSKGVYLKGDLPIGMGADSVEATIHPEQYNLDSSTGAPPDFFTADGQNWGFPTYNWDAMAKDGFAWWKARLRKMSKYFDAFRIDHVLGFFRIWEIPLPEKGGLLGHFNPAIPYSREEIVSAGLPIVGLFIEDPHREGMFHPLISPDTSALQDWQKERYYNMYNDFFFRRHNEFWKRNAMRKLPELLSCTGMLACAEDLGMVPDCVPEVLDHEKILSLEMPRVEKDSPWTYLSVCATSSHDTGSIRLWDGPDKDPSECRRILQDNLDSVSMLAIFPLQDWMSIDGRLRHGNPADEQVNHPEDPDNKWRWRMHLTLRQLLDEAAFTTKVATLVKDSNR
ncbi:MAG: 4-alpha-glucanotransferase [Bacteroidales bacterium]|nr:4-alpha-glucanotransferase [Bacteroidales bacterium]